MKLRLKVNLAVLCILLILAGCVAPPVSSPPLASAALPQDQYIWLSAASVPKAEALRVNIAFPEAMDTAWDWFDTIIMTDPDRNRIDTRLIWNEDDKTLTVRPKEFIGDFSDISVNIAKNARSAAGTVMEQECAMRVDINADPGAAIG